MDKGCHNDDNSGDDDDCFPLLRRSSCSLAVDDTSRSITTPPSPSSNGKFSFEQYAVEGWRWCSDETLAGSGAAVKVLLVVSRNASEPLASSFLRKKSAARARRGRFLGGGNRGRKLWQLFGRRKMHLPLKKGTSCPTQPRTSRPV